ncbi:MAG TPA: hypothetical protein VLY85_03840, partial [Thermoplasmata archaeon]|nr:hypothetical protein [Thermoplasmata archaeon]
VRFSVLPSYPVDFLDPGMPSGTSWWVNLTTVPSDAAAYSATNSTSAASIGFSVVNGTYDWTAGASVNGTTVEASGSVWVGGNRTSVHVTFPNVPALPTLTFEASGLPRGTNWSVTLTSPAGEFRIEATLTRWSDGASTVSFRVSPGTYAFSISAPGYTRASGNVTVSGTAPTSVPVSFQPLGSVGPGASGLPVPAWAAWIGVAFLVLGASGLGLTVYRSRARERAMGSALAARLFDTEWTRDGDGEPEPRTDR